MQEIRELRTLITQENERTRAAVESHKLQTNADYRELRGMVEADRKTTAEEFKDVRATMGEMLERLAAGSERFDHLRSRIEAVEERGGTTALVARPRPMDRSSERIQRKRKTPPWWMMALIGGGLAVAGQRGYYWLAHMAAQDPTMQTAPTTKP
jgi:hypothetical protein